MLLPDRNFYCFKIDEGFDEEREEREELEIMRLIQDAVDHGSWVMNMMD